MAFGGVVKQRSMEAEGGGFRAVNQAGRIVRAHLEKDAHLEFRERLSTEIAVDVVIGVARCNDVEAKAGAFGNQIVENGGWVYWRISVAAAEAKIFLIPQLVGLVDALNDQEHWRRVGRGRIVVAGLHFRGEVLEDF